ncbi:ATP-binding protein [Mesorhizobium sp.]|uniref:ATP-binding protein n=1 Tax=Mesorhizobium sp. TaxID=1871066 RepID=UPI003BAB1DBD
MEQQSPQKRVILSFGRFELYPSERLLKKDGVPLELGGRALDTLIALVSRPNEVVGKRELMAAVWPDVTVDEGSLRFHIAGVRKALGDGKGGARYIATLAGRGYCFVAPLTRSESPTSENTPTEPASPRATFLPARLPRMIGREDSVRAIAAELATSRFVTIVGPGGVGKTTVAVAVAHDLMPLFNGAVLFVDFGLLSDSRMVPVSVASMMGLSVQSDDPVPSLIALLRERRMLVVLDNCEHVIEDAARLTEQLFLAAPEIRILATSREPLRAEGERVHRLAPLETPPEDAELTAEATLEFPAARLFVERAIASGARMDFGEANAAIVADICRKLDGMALAIELAAGRVEAYGLKQTAALLDERLTLLWPGQRTAPPRQKTLRATLDWSYGLLSEAERVVFRRLAIFVGPFTIDAALAVVTNEKIDAAWVFAAIDSLVAKSMVTAFPAGAMMRYRLLDTARAYAQDISMDTAERTALAARHAQYCLRWLNQFANDARLLLDAARRASHLGDLNNVRAALEWCFGDEGNVGSGVSLASAAAPVFFAMSLLTECQRWSLRAILALDDKMFGGRQEMRLQAALALSSMWTNSNSEVTFAAMNRSIAIAKQLGDPLNQILLLAPLHVFHLCAADFEKAMQCAEQVSDLSRQTEDSKAVELSRILLGYSFHFAGDLAKARRELEAALRPGQGDEHGYAPTRSSSVTMIDDAMGAPILALASSAAPSALARTLWLQGDSEAALNYVNQTIIAASSTNHPVTLLVALLYAICVMIWNGNLDEAEQQIDRFISNAESYDLDTYILLGRCFEGQLAIRRGDNEHGIKLIQRCLHGLHALRYELMTTSFNISLAQAFAATGRIDEGISLVDAAIQSVEQNGDACYMPELLRVKANLLLNLPVQLDGLAQACFTESLALSRRQGALAWELRTSIDLARLSAARGNTPQARALLQPVVIQFADGAKTADLQTAQSLLATWG